MSSAPPLSQGTGYGVVLGLGFAFAFGMILTTYILKRYNAEVQTSEMFSTAGRTVKSGLVASAVVSSWTWAATLLQSSGVAYRYGVSGPFWYASGATVQILLFATLAIELKRRAPNAHTFLEVIRARYGVYAHLVYTVFGLMTNVLVTTMVSLLSHAQTSKLTSFSVAYRWERRRYIVDRRTYTCSMLSFAHRRGPVYHSRRDQGHVLNGLRTYCDDSHHHIHLCFHGIHYQCQSWKSVQGLRSSDPGRH